MPEIDHKTYIAGFTRVLLDRLIKDFDALPADKQTTSAGGCARAPLNILAECALFNGWIATYLTTGDSARPAPEARKAQMDALDTPDKARTRLQQETERLLAAIAALDPATLGDDCSEVLKRPMTRLALAEFPAIHMMYHDGQLNFLQTLCGDPDIHW